MDWYDGHCWQCGSAAQPDVKGRVLCSRCRFRHRYRWHREDLGGRQLPHQTPRIPLRRQRGDEDLDLFARPSLRLREHGRMVLRREMTSDQPHGSEAQLAGGEQIENHREAAAHSGRLDPIAGSVFGEPKRLRAIRVDP